MEGWEVAEEHDLTSRGVLTRVEPHHLTMYLGNYRANQGTRASSNEKKKRGRTLSLFSISI